MSLNRVIGNRGTIPWHLPEDFKWFKQLTMGHLLVMGRKTYESIGKPLPGRETVILSRSGFAPPGTRSIPDLTELGPIGDRTAFICGGAQIYKQYLSLCDELFLTTVKRVVEGDAFFPHFEENFIRAELVRDTPEFRIERWVASKQDRLPEACEETKSS